MEIGVHGQVGQHALDHVAQRQEQGSVIILQLAMEVKLVLDQALNPKAAS